MPGRSIPTPNETMILRLLWQQGPLTVRQIRDGLLTQKKLAYTSVLTIVAVLTRKGWLERQRVGRADVYQPVLDEAQGKQLILQELAGRLFDGSLAALGEFVHACDASAPVVLPSPRATKRPEAAAVEAVALERPEPPTSEHFLDVDLL